MSSAPATRVFWADASRVFRQAVERFAATHPRLVVVGWAASGEDAVRQVLRLRPDLVMLDVALPGLGGLEVARRIKAQPGSPRVVLLASDEGAEYQAAAKAVGADGLVAKAEVGTRLIALVEAWFAPDGASASARDVA